LFLTLLRIPLLDPSFSGGKLAISPSAFPKWLGRLGGGDGKAAALAVTSDGASSMNAPGGFVCAASLAASLSAARLADSRASLSAFC
jgi:hypothetical protein